MGLNEIASYKAGHGDEPQRSKLLVTRPTSAENSSVLSASSFQSFMPTCAHVEKMSSFQDPGAVLRGKASSVFEKGRERNTMTRQKPREL